MGEHSARAVWYAPHHDEGINIIVMWCKSFIISNLICDTWLKITGAPPLHHPPYLFFTSSSLLIEQYGLTLDVPPPPPPPSSSLAAPSSSHAVNVVVHLKVALDLPSQPVICSAPSSCPSSLQLVRCELPGAPLLSPLVWSGRRHDGVLVVLKGLSKRGDRVTVSPAPPLLALQGSAFHSSAPLVYFAQLTALDTFHIE